MNNKTDLKTINGVPMMSSRNIANVVKKDHGKVCRDIRVMLGKLYNISEADSTRNPELAYHTKQGVTCIQYDVDNPNAWEYWLDYEHSQCLVAGYDASRRMSIIRQWQTLKEEVKQLQTPIQSTQQEISMNHDILSLARVVAEATASATMKAVMEVSGANLVAASPVSSSVPQQRISSTEFVNTDAEFVPVHKISWETGLSDPSCRRLVRFANLPSRQLPGVRGLCVHRESFLHAFQVLLEESVRPSGKRKRWQHPEFGGFILRKDPKEIFGEGHHGE
ncbi:transcriptional regulator [Citrobacter freundii]|uniref:transcriptional regulator n=1 Tax=Citrobacter freundii TaxID=546 RepID=UPI00292AD6C2|nr:transcriptional regulator [Citrobacter freundii]MDV1856370.1 transcriptional regulator [Citrobacter freundii]MEB0417564.1 transcriptional regulator [Citrobacter freundii]